MWKILIIFTLLFFSGCAMPEEPTSNYTKPHLPETDYGQVYRKCQEAQQLGTTNRHLVIEGHSTELHYNNINFTICCCLDTEALCLCKGVEK